MITGNKWVVRGKVGFSGNLRGNKGYLSNYGVILVFESIFESVLQGEVRVFSISIYLICSIVVICIFLVVGSSRSENRALEFRVAVFLAVV